VITSLENEYATRTGQAIPFKFGILERDRMKLPPCVVWIPQPGSITKPKSVTVAGEHRARTLWDKSHPFRIECWATSNADAETLQENLLALLQIDLRGSIDIGAWGWVTQGSATSGLNLTTSKIYQIATIWSPVLDQALALTAIEHVNQEAILGDDWTGEVSSNG
jgi:hypothetical protein